MKKIIIVITLLILSHSCSKDDKVNDNPEDDVLIELDLTLVSKNSYSSSFDYSYTSELENVKLLWFTNDAVDLNNYLGKVDLTINNSSKTIYNLESYKSYYFKLVGEINGEAYYSDLVSLRTSAVQSFYNGEIASSITTSYIEEIIKKDDGYLVVTGYGDITVHKLDNDFNLLWSTEIVERDTNFFKSIIDLENGEYILFGSGNTNTTNATHNTKSFAVKIDESGNKLWTKYYHYADNTDWTFWWNDIVKFKNKGTDIKLLTSVDTTYNGDGFDKFFHEYTLDYNGDIISQKTLPYTYDQFLNIAYDNDGNIYNYGTTVLDLSSNNLIMNGVLEKYNENNELIWSEHYNDEIYGDDSLDRIFVNENYIVSIGTENHPLGEYRLVHFRNNEGNLLWEYKETDGCIYQGYDIISSFDDNFVVTFLDLCVSRRATLINFDTEGNVIWTYKHNGGYVPHKVFYDNGEYQIFGIKDAKLWLKRIRID